MTIPSRLAGYGAYNLCFDKYLGRKNANFSDPDFFAAIRNSGFNRVNLVKVICFRYSQKESLPADRAIPLYVNQGGRVLINSAFLDNLNTLVTSAERHGFWVQVCTFHYQAIATPNGGTDGIPEVPEVLPAELAPMGADACTRLANWFNPRPANPEQLGRQKELIHTIADRLKGHGNVLYEIGNELRLATPGCAAPVPCQLTEWLNIMGNQVLSVIGPTNNIGTSTGGYADPPTALNNEKAVFQTCPKVFQPGFFDFHRGQWDSTITDPMKLAEHLGQVGARANGYKGRVTPLIINDDGTGLERSADNVALWAKAAFSQRLHFASKQPYPNGGKDKNGVVLDFSLPVLTKLNAAAA
ncbi:MAG TPA: hypothetical protein VGC87_08785 [Pyrinomonadaceae bacterium]|jgi:hypothetical protein